MKLKAKQLLAGDVIHANTGRDLHVVHACEYPTRPGFVLASGTCLDEDDEVAPWTLGLPEDMELDVSRWATIH